MFARTIEIADPGDLVQRLAGSQAPGQAWLRRGDGMIAFGEVARWEFTTISEGEALWQGFVADLDHDDQRTTPELFGSGPIAFGSFTFDQRHTARRSVLVVPELVLGRRGNRSWLTQISTDREQLAPHLPPIPDPPLPPGEVSWSDGALSGPQWEGVVAEVIDRIRAGAVGKVVLARELVARTPAPIDPRWLVRALARDYSSTWTFWVDDMLGASPEMLVRREGGLATSRVLAGTIWRTPGQDGEAIAAALADSSKDLIEHEYAVKSVAEALAPHCSGMNVPDSPYVLELPNVSHLATDVTAVAHPGTTSLALAEALHPSAAVCGTPTQAAKDLIAEVEQLDRGRYAGPVGWLDVNGDGEWAIALRCARLTDDPHELLAYAGCGIVSDSDPAQELAETQAKLVPIRDALAG